MSQILFPYPSSVPEVEVWSHEATCVDCGRSGRAYDVRRRQVRTKGGPVVLRVSTRVCDTPGCASFRRRLGAEFEYAIAPPHWTADWELFVWMGHRRFSRHWSTSILRGELHDTFGLDVSDDWIEDYLRRYQIAVYGRQSDLRELEHAYRGIEDFILTIDGLQPEKGHETLYIVRELRSGRIWFATPLLSSAYEEMRPLFERAKKMAEQLGKPVRAWMSDKQQVFVRCIAEVFPEVPHRFCANHFIRDLAKPVLELDSHAKVAMRAKVRGLREVEREMLATMREARSPVDADPSTGGEPLVSVGVVSPMPQDEDTHAAPAPSDEHATAGTLVEQCQVVRDYCGAVRAALNNNRGGPLTPPGVRMDGDLAEIQESMQRALAESEKGGPNRRRRPPRRPKRRPDTP